MNYNSMVLERKDKLKFIDSLDDKLNDGWRIRGFTVTGNTYVALLVKEEF